LLDRIDQTLLEREPVRQSGQPIAVRTLEEPLFGALELGDVDRETNRTDDRTVLVAQRLDLMVEPTLAARALRPQRRAGVDVLEKTLGEERVARRAQELLRPQAQIAQRSAGDRGET
jgi:hypothetical protein